MASLRVSSFVTPPEVRRSVEWYRITNVRPAASTASAAGRPHA
jgi:hypothetical protein